MISKYKDFVKNLFKKKEKVLTKKEQFIKDLLVVDGLNLEMRFRFIKSAQWGTLISYEPADTEDELVKKIRQGKIQFDESRVHLSGVNPYGTRTVVTTIELLIMRWMIGETYYNKYIDKIYKKGSTLKYINFEGDGIDYSKLSRQLDTLLYKLADSGISEGDVKFDQRYGPFEYGPYITFNVRLEMESIVALINLIWVDDDLKIQLGPDNNPKLVTRRA
jgi:hypothetical protein